MLSEQREAEHQKLVGVRRCTKVVKGGRRFSFSVAMVVGDGKGVAGFGSGKASEIADAKNKALAGARRQKFRVPLKDGRTLHHDVTYKFGSGKVILRSAPPGTGIIAGGALRAFLEVLGVKDIVAKSIGSTNAHNMIKAAMGALKNVRSPRFIAEKRGKNIGEILRYRNNNNKRKVIVQEENNEQNQG
jgi:small subunit ribosomal protein S5